MELIKVRLIAAAGCFHQRIRAWHEFFLVLNQDCELVSQLPNHYNRRLQNAKSRINTAFFCCQNKISPHGLW
jgi:hypothetical protein